MREYAKTIEKELAQVERASVDDCTPESGVGGVHRVPPLTMARDLVAEVVGRSTDINQSPQLEALQGQIKVCQGTPFCMALWNNIISRDIGS